MTERYADLGGGQKPSPYDGGSLERECKTCGAKVGDKCTFEASFKGERRTRHMPCLARLTNRGSAEESA